MNSEKTLEHIFRTIVREENEKLYEKLKNKGQNNSNETNDEVMNFEGFCKYVGCSRSHAYKLTSNNAVPFSRKNGRLWFSKTEIDNWLMSGKPERMKHLEANAHNFLKQKKQ